MAAGPPPVPVRRPAYGLLVERDKCVRAKPASLVGNHPVGKIPAGGQRRQPGLHGWPIDHDIGRIDQPLDRCRDIGVRNVVALRQHPDERALRRHGQGNHIRAGHGGPGDLALLRTVCGDGAHEHARIGRDLHRVPAQARAAMRFISLIDRDRPWSRFSKPKTSDIRPTGRAARTSIRP